MKLEIKLTSNRDGTIHTPLLRVTYAHSVESDVDVNTTVSVSLLYSYPFSQCFMYSTAITNVRTKQLFVGFFRVFFFKVTHI